MQQKMLHRKFNEVRRLDETEYNPIVYERKEKIEKFKKLRKEGCSEKVILEILEITRATYYHWKKSYTLNGLSGLEDQSKRPNTMRTRTWSKLVEQRVYLLRKKFPLWGKAKIAVRYKTEYRENISESTVGRVIKKLCSQNKVMPVRFLYGKKETRRRIFNGHAQRWKLGMHATKPGELIQIDHMTIQMPDIGQVKHFNAICPVTKFSVYKVYKEATSLNAADFLEHMKQQFPFPISSIQVDGGSEFMSTFEKAAQQSNISLYVLPPRSPEYNGNVERGNGTEYEFYYQV
jgi:transposase